MASPDPMFFDFRLYFKVLRLALTDTPKPKRLAIHLLLLLLIPLWAAFNAIFLLLDYVWTPFFRKTEIKQPVFIVGNARSGTTFFHRLLCGDEERFTHFRMWELLFPSVIQKKIIRGAFGLFERLFPKAFQALVKWEAGLFPELSKQHPIGINKPEEDELILLMSFSSAMINIFFPYTDQLTDLTRFEDRPIALRKKLLGFYRGCVRRQLYLYGGDRTLVSKNPAFVAKMRDLSIAFPDAKFIYLVRNPFETVPSLLKLISSMWEGLGIESAHTEKALQEIIEGCVHDYYYALEVMDELPPERYAIVQYTDLVSDPQSTVETVYEKLELDLSPAFAEKLSTERKRQKRYHSENAYSLEQFGIDPQWLAKELGPFMDRFGFNPEDAPNDETTEIL
jgi:hypothetical protein